MYVHGLDTATPHYPKPRYNLSSYQTIENWALISLVCPKVADTADMASIREQASNILFRPFISIAPVVKAIEPPSVKGSPHIWLLWRGVEAFVGVFVIPAVVPLIWYLVVHVEIHAHPRNSLLVHGGTRAHPRNSLLVHPATHARPRKMMRLRRNDSWKRCRCDGRLNLN